VDYVEYEHPEKKGVALLCAAYSDEEYRKEKCKDDKDYDERVGQFYTGKLWRRDILPIRRYLCMCLNAAATCGTPFVDNFLSESYLGDKKTSLSSFLEEKERGRDPYILRSGNVFSLPLQEVNRM